MAVHLSREMVVSLWESEERMKTRSGYRSLHRANSRWETAGESSRAWQGKSSGTGPRTASEEKDGLARWARMTRPPLLRTYSTVSSAEYPAPWTSRISCSPVMPLSLLMISWSPKISGRFATGGIFFQSHA